MKISFKNGSSIETPDDRPRVGKEKEYVLTDIKYWKRNKEGKMVGGGHYLVVNKESIIERLPDDISKLTDKDVEEVTRLVCDLLAKGWNMNGGEILKIGKLLIKIPPRLFIEVSEEEEIEIVTEAISNEEEKKGDEDIGSVSTFLTHPILDYLDVWYHKKP